MALEAILSGGGIGGLATATALAQRGWRVSVFERSSEIRASGSGIYLSNNGLAVLSELGAHDLVMRNPFFGCGIEQRDHLDRMILPAELPPGVRLVAVPRNDLMAGLYASALSAGVRVVTGIEVVDAGADGTLVFSDGSRLQADLAIGCDGVGSRVRRGLGLEIFVQPTSEGALRTIIRATQDDFPAAARGRFIENWNGRRRLLITPINEKEVYLALTCPADDHEARDVRIQPCWRESFPTWAHLIDRIAGDVTWNVYAVVQCKSWSAGRACVVGDAAHATTPNLGQGGGMAMQNGLALAAYVANVHDRRDIPAALAAWEAAMRPLIELSQRWASLFGEIANIPDDVRTQIIRAALSHPWVLEQLTAAARSTPITHVAWSPSRSTGGGEQL